MYRATVPGPCTFCVGTQMLWLGRSTEHRAQHTEHQQVMGPCISQGARDESHGNRLGPEQVACGPPCALPRQSKGGRAPKTQRPTPSSGFEHSDKASVAEGEGDRRREAASGTSAVCSCLSSVRRPSAAVLQCPKADAPC